VQRHLKDRIVGGVAVEVRISTGRPGVTSRESISERGPNREPSCAAV
jgi:hypothetical protein